ncbi:hypothetical protein [Methanocaldococcus fervens]|uniref:Uncharacterized protein n=1 Tax=Methanocaldococcus fervens (strain DSM 4213 / JCM 15782 / AG86) TaxID=573064 RepID=C7P8X0_METFA|nr:hypothetical protein [Methanocaldococcus fervens]ACV25002.1 hypothetical protein Mefer_1193 [Methanocaldococcus fervens AG86]
MELEEKLKEIAKKAKKGGKDDLADRVKNLEKVAIKLYNNFKSESQPNEKTIEQEQHENEIEQHPNQYFDKIEEINNKLDKILDIIGNNKNCEKIENLLKEILAKFDELKYTNLSEEAINKISDKVKQIYDSSKMELMEKLDTIIERINDYSSKLDRLSDGVDDISNKIDTISEKIKDLLDIGGVKVVDIIKLIKEIYKGIDEIKKILNSSDDENIDKAIDIVDELNSKIDNYIEEIEKELS